MPSWTLLTLLLAATGSVISSPLGGQTPSLVKRADSNIPDTCTTSCASYISTFTTCGELGYPAVNPCQCSNSTAATVVSCLGCLSGTGNATNAAYVTNILSAYNGECVGYLANNGTYTWVNTTATNPGGLIVAASSSSSSPSATSAAPAAATTTSATSGTSALHLSFTVFVMACGFASLF